MSTSTLTSDTRVTDQVALDRAAAAMGAKRRVEVEVLEAALGWAHAHVVGPDAAPGGRRPSADHASRLSLEPAAMMSRQRSTGC